MAQKCTTCGEVFQSDAEMRKHYQSDLHAENVRRRIDGKRPMTQREFKLTQGGEVNEAAVFSCSLCNKKFHSMQTLQSHVKSTEHLMRKEQRILKREGEGASAITTSSLGSAAMGLHRRFKAHNKLRQQLHADPSAPPNPKVPLEQREADVDELTCFFCGLHSLKMAQNLAHMAEQHEFQVPLLHRCIDVQALLLYLARKINGLMCFVCNESTRHFQSLAALRAHMKESHHDYVPLGPEYQEFYHGTLDSEEASEDKMPSDQLVVRNGMKVIYRRDENIPLRKMETPQMQERRRLLAAETSDQLAIIKKERYEAIKAELKAEIKIQRRQCDLFHGSQMKLGVAANKMHKRGYEGDPLNIM